MVPDLPRRKPLMGLAWQMFSAKRYDFLLALAASLSAWGCVAIARPGQSQSADHSQAFPFMSDVEPARSGTPAWFGLRLPGPRTDPREGIVATTDTDLPARPATFAPGPLDPVLGGSALHRDVATLVDFSHESEDAGDYLWGRITGRMAYRKTVDWVTARLSAAGLQDAHREPFRQSNVSLPVSGEVRLVGGEGMGIGSRDVILHSAMVEGEGPVNGRITAPLIYAGQGMDADLAGRNLKGKIAVIFTTPDPSIYAAVPARRIGAVLAAGAVGVIEILVQPGNLQSFDRDRHGCGRQLCFTVGGEDGYFLENVLGAAARAGKIVTARLSARSETLDNEIANVVATIPGKTDRTVIIDAHADGWFGGADDNGSGLAVMIALARHFAKLGRLDRTLVFFASAGHHSKGANGVRAFRAMHENDYVARADLILNIEHVAQSAMMRSYIARQDDNFGSPMVAASGDLPKQVGVNNRAPFLIDLWRQGIRCFGLDAQRVVDTALPGDLNGFADLHDVAQTQMIASGGVYHTSGDDLYSVPPEALERAARFYAYFIAQVADAPGDALQGHSVPHAANCPLTP
jgi:hypothetical protein